MDDRHELLYIELGPEGLAAFLQLKSIYLP